MRDKYCEHKKMIGKMAKINTLVQGWEYVDCVFCKEEQLPQPPSDWLVELIRKAWNEKGYLRHEDLPEYFAGKIRSHIQNNGPRCACLSRDGYMMDLSHCQRCKTNLEWLKFFSPRKDGE